MRENHESVHRLRPRDWKYSPNWRSYFSNANKWLNYETESWLSHKSRKLAKYPAIIKILPMLLFGLTKLLYFAISYALRLPVMAVGLAMFLYGMVSNGVLEAVYTLFTFGAYIKHKKLYFDRHGGQYEEGKKSLFFWERPVILAQALWDVLSFWPQGLLSKGLHIFLIKPLLLAITPVLLAVATAQELLLSASFGLGMLIIAAPFIIPAITYYVVNLPRAIFNGLKALCCCKKKSQEDDWTYPQDLHENDPELEGRIFASPQRRLFKTERNDTLPTHYPDGDEPPRKTCCLSFGYGAKRVVREEKDSQASNDFLNSPT